MARPLRVLFAAAAGPRLGFGHLVRCRSLARALGVPQVVALRASAAVRRRTASGGWRLVGPRDGAALRTPGLDWLIVDDPSPAAARAWVARARRAGVPVATIHDLGIGAVESDLVIDGSVLPGTAVRGRFGTLRGPAYAILDPALRTARERPRGAAPRRVLVALGGGRHVYGVAARLARAIAARVDDVEIRGVSGFTAPRRPPLLAGGRWVDVRDGLATELASAAVAVVGGGVTMYEACAIGTPAVALAVTPAQRGAIDTLARLGAVVDGGLVPGTTDVSDRVAGEIERLLDDAAARTSLRRAGRHVIDARGAFRVGARLGELAAVASGRRHVS